MDYRLARWVLCNMSHDNVLSAEETSLILKNIAEQYDPPFLFVEDLERGIGDGVSVDG